MEDLRTVIRDGQEVLRAGADDLSEKGKEARARLEDALRRAKSTCESTCEQFEGRAGDAAREVESAIREHPLTSIGAAFGVGVLLGVLLNNRR